MYSDIFCKVYNEFGWNYYPEAFGEQLLAWLQRHDIKPKTALDLACGTGILCEILHNSGIETYGMDLSPGMIAIAKDRNCHIHYDVADMITYRPGRRFDLITCTGDALNHIPDLANVEKIFRNMYDSMHEGGYFIFDILNEHEVSDSEPFEMDVSETTRVWFQMTCPKEKQVNLKIQVYENGVLQFEENIGETVHDPSVICELLQKCGFTVVRCADNLQEGSGHGTTWYVIARKCR